MTQQQQRHTEYKSLVAFGKTRTILILMAKTKSQKQVTANVTDGFERLWDLYVVKFFAAS